MKTPCTDNDGQVIIFKDEGTHLDESLSLFDEYHKRNDQFFTVLRSYIQKQQTQDT